MDYTEDSFGLQFPSVSSADSPISLSRVPSMGISLPESLSLVFCTDSWFGEYSFTSSLASRPRSVSFSLSHSQCLSLSVSPSIPHEDEDSGMKESA